MQREDAPSRSVRTTRVLAAAMGAGCAILVLLWLGASPALARIGRATLATPDHRRMTRAELAQGLTKYGRPTWAFMASTEWNGTMESWIRHEERAARER